MLSHLHEYASSKEVDSILLISESHGFYTVNGYLRVDSTESWLRLDEHKNNYGVAVERVDDLYIKPIRSKNWSDGDMDWLGYMY